MAENTFTKNFPYRVKTSGLQTVANAGTQDFLGSDFSGTNRRGQFIITNLDASLSLYLRLKGDTKVFAVVFPRSVLAFNIQEDITLDNESGGSIQYTVCELFYDDGVFPLSPGLAGAASAAVATDTTASNLPTGKPLPRPGLPAGRASTGISRPSSGRSIGSSVKI